MVLCAKPVTDDNNSVQNLKLFFVQITECKYVSSNIFFCQFNHTGTYEIPKNEDLRQELYIATGKLGTLISCTFSYAP